MIEGETGVRDAEGVRPDGYAGDRDADAAGGRGDPDPGVYRAEGDVTRAERIRSAVCEPGDDLAYERPADDPIKRHWGWTHSRTIALCGARLIGVTAPESHPFVCEECERLHEEFLRERGGVS